MSFVEHLNKQSVLNYRSALDTLFCSVLMLHSNGEVAYYNDSARRLMVASDTSLEELLSLVRNQIDLGRGAGRYNIDTAKANVICNVYPWFSDGVRIGCTLILHVARHTHCITQEAELADNLLQEISIFIESSYDAFMVTDSKGKIIRVNAALEKAMSVARRDLMGRYVSDLVAEGVFPTSAVLQVLETGEIANVLVEKDHKKLFVTAKPVYDSPGNLASVVVNVRDMTELDELRREVERQQIMAEAYSRELAHLTNKRTCSTDIVVHSKEMHRIMDTVNSIATVDSTILITGESGVGKELIVNQIYCNSNRNKKPIIKINCGAIPITLFESELFGYEPGAFTGARRRGKAGFFELADGGTLFLDEIGELSMEAQVKLLRVIQEGEITRIGGSANVTVDVRIIAATNKDLWAMAENGSFRKDLYYRLNVISVDVPPLRNRRDEIVPLAMFFLDKYNSKYSKKKQLSLELAKIIRALDWPGNIRELENFIENMVVLANESTLMPKHLPPRYQKAASSDNGVIVNGILPLKKVLQEAEAQLLQNAKERFQTTTEIAKVLGVDQSTISRKLRQQL